MLSPRWLLVAALVVSVSAAGVAAASSASQCTELAKGKFLVAKRGIGDPRFSESVILLVDHDDKGTLGVIINRRSDILLSEALPQVDSLRRRDDKLFFGGPVSRHQVLLLMRSSKAPPGAVRVFDSVYFSPGSALLDGGLSDVGSLRAYAGYAGWAHGQLAAELARGDWFIADADAHSIFSALPASVWPALITRFEGQWALRAGIQPGC